MVPLGRLGYIVIGGHSLKDYVIKNKTLLLAADLELDEAVEVEVVDKDTIIINNRGP